ncbi:MAG: septum formation protein Maf [Oligoflexales bacterium]|nr:septum formation protein Maf [Oligoflexales bacterium]
MYKENQKLFLASSSPRRIELLAQLGLKPEVLPSDFEEKRREGEKPDDYVLRNARGKGEWVCEHKIRGAHAGPGLVISADSIVVLDSKVLEKPVDDLDAEKMLMEMSGRWHYVLTGLSLISVDEQGCIQSRQEGLYRTEVLFKPISKAEIQSYIATGDHRGKSGSFSIQGKGCHMVREVKGSVTNVMGLPLSDLVDLLLELGVIRPSK